jgi:hypothetical protein
MNRRDLNTCLHGNWVTDCFICCPVSTAPDLPTPTVADADSLDDVDQSLAILRDQIAKLKSENETLRAVLGQMVDKIRHHLYTKQDISRVREIAGKALVVLKRSA